MVEVKEGLAAGDKVIMAPDEQMLAALPPVSVDEQSQTPIPVGAPGSR